MVVVPPTVNAPDCVMAPPAVQFKLRVTFWVPRMTPLVSLSVASLPLVTTAVPKLLVVVLKVMSLPAPVEVNVAVPGTTSAPDCVKPAPVAVKEPVRVRTFKSKAVVSNTDTF